MCQCICSIPFLSLLLIPSCSVPLRKVNYFGVTSCQMSWTFPETSTIRIWQKYIESLKIHDLGFLRYWFRLLRGYGSWVTNISDSLQTHGLQPARLLCSWDSLGTNTGVGCCLLLQGIFLTQDLTRVSFIAGRFFTHWAKREAIWAGGEIRTPVRMPLY